jgi:NTE family protein
MAKTTYSYRLLIILLCFSISATAQKERPKIGIALSGGGAKGLAHIGILKAIDSAGLPIDYITGTSMGSIIGSLYAVGYSTDSIISVAKGIDWDVILSNQSRLTNIFMEEKDEYSKYIIELPWKHNRFYLPSGLLEAQELWLKLSELYFPVYNIKDFSKFAVPFRCIATDVGDGSAVILNQGEIINAIRASMAIPSVFTAVDYDSTKLVDGGIIRNFPVSDLKEMGADLIIGSDVSSGLMPSDKVRNVLHVLMQIAFFREAEVHKKQIEECDIYVPINLENFNMGSFSDVSKIIDIGLEEGRKLYPSFKKMADSLRNIYGEIQQNKKELPNVNDVYLLHAEVKGTSLTTDKFFLHTIEFKNNQHYSAKKLANMVRQAYGTRYYNRITYSIEPLSDQANKIVFYVTENDFNLMKLGLHYNKFTGVNLILNFTGRNIITPNSRTLATLSVGETMRMRGEHLQYIGRTKRQSIILDGQWDRFDVATYQNYRQDGAYSQNIFKLGARTQYSSKRMMSVGIGTKFELIRNNPTIRSGFEMKGRSNFFTSFVYFNVNNLDKTILPNKGVKLYTDVSWVGRQSNNIYFTSNGIPIINQNSYPISTDPYLRTEVNFESYIPLKDKKFTLMINADAGSITSKKEHVMNEFIVGGLTKMFRNQITFAGLPEATLYTPSLVKAGIGLRARVFANGYIGGRSNIMLPNLIKTSNIYNNPNVVTGHALSFTYNFALGPLEISAMYSENTGRLFSYVNLGIPF